MGATSVVPASIAPGNPMNRKVVVEKRLQVLVENVVDAQRALTRAMLQRDEASRKLALGERDTAVERLYEYVAALDIERQRHGKERLRAAHDVVQLHLVIAELELTFGPALVGKAFNKARLRLAKDDRISQTFVLRLNTAIDSGLAERVDGDVVITYAGLQALIRSDVRTDEVETLRAETFELERRLRAKEAIIAAHKDHLTGAVGAGV